MAELPIIQKTYDLIKRCDLASAKDPKGLAPRRARERAPRQWYIPILNRLPRNHRFALGDRMSDNLYDEKADKLLKNGKISNSPTPSNSSVFH